MLKNWLTLLEFRALSPTELVNKKTLLIYILTKKTCNLIIGCFKQ